MAATLTPRTSSFGLKGSRLPGGASSSRKLKASTAPRDSEFLRLVERTEDAFALKTTDDADVDDVRRILSEVRSQYDQVHAEAEKKEVELTRLKEAIRLADQAHSAGAEDVSKMDDMRSSLEAQIKATNQAIHEQRTSKKVYNHMLARISKEQALLKEKLLAMEAHLERKGNESHRKVALQERLVRKGAQTSQDLEMLELEVEHERAIRDEAHRHMVTALKAKEDARDRRNRFTEWRREVAKHAANEAFNASAGRLRKLYAIEKLAGNCLQKITFEQEERSQTTEDGFQRIREVTGLTDVMDIVHKFLNREVEHEQLKSSVKEAEVRLDSLREQFDRFKRDTDGFTFDIPGAGLSRAIYLDVEEHEELLATALKEHELSRNRLQQSTLQVEHMKRWTNRTGRSLAMFEDCISVDKPADLPVCYQQMQRAVDKFIQHIALQISAGKVQKKNMPQVVSKEFHEAQRLLTDKDFLRVNCRVPASLDPGNVAPAGKPAPAGGKDKDEEDSAEMVQQEREKFKNESRERVADATRKLDMQKKKSGSAQK